ncbi:uncharacterized protein LOC106534550, partial [Austrofundulus limnaeus]|uniref:Uncharacterized protein LOC106534550 n=1 Tax=Austrofundulus limnaeus TaxID=52670 RepID=A0A2I4D372_AUSLI
MAMSEDKVKSFVDELRAEFNSGQRPPGALIETWISLTPQEQMKVLGQLMQSTESSSQTLSDQEAKMKASLDDTEQRRTEEKTKMKWIKFQERKMRRVLDMKLEKTMKERDELEMMKISLNRQSQEIKKTLEDFKTIFTTVAKTKVKMEKTAAEITATCEKIYTTQRKTENNSEEIKLIMDKLASVKNQISTWTLAHPATMKTLSTSD